MQPIISDDHGLPVAAMVIVSGNVGDTLVRSLRGRGRTLNMNETPTRSAKRFRLLIIGSMLSMFIVLVGLVIIFSEGTYTWSRVTMISVCFAFVSSTLAERTLHVQVKQQPWSELAVCTGLSYHPGNIWLGYPERVAGDYRGYHLSLYTSRTMRGHAPCTRIELVLPTRVAAFLRVRGPYDRADIGSEEGFKRMFGTESLYHIGYERFLIRSQPLALGQRLFGTDGRRHGPLRYRLLQLKPNTSIELDGYRLHLEHFEPATDTAYLQLLFDLLVDLANGLAEPPVVPTIEAEA